MSLLEKLNALLTGGRDKCLADTYGMEAEELAQLMNNWRNSAAGPNT